MANHKEQPNKVPVLSIDDLGEIHPFFQSHHGRIVGKGLMKLLKITEINNIHTDYSQLSGVALTSAILSDPRVAVTYTIHGEEHLRQLDNMGAFFTVSNHPYGGLDGLILIDIMARVRNDFMVLVNGILNQVTALKDYWISVTPQMNNRIHDPNKNITGLRLVVDRITGEHPVGMFPAGGLPHYNKELKRPMEIPWKLNNIRIIKAGGVPVVPIMFEGNNSRSYFRFGHKWGYDTASILIPKEILNKRGQNIDVYIGEPISPDELHGLGNLASTRDYLMERSLSILPTYRELQHNL